MFLKIHSLSSLLLIAVRTWYFRKLFRSFGEGARVLGKIKVINPGNISIGKNSTLNEGVFLNARDSLTIGSNVHISPGVIINTGGLDYKNFKEKRVHIKKSVYINDGVWIGSGAIVNPGVIIGEDSVVAAGAVVTKNVPAKTLVGKVPAEVLRSL